MATTSGHFANEYTFEVADIPVEFSNFADVIERNALAAIEYLSDFVRWNGSIDFVVRFGAPDQFGHDGSGLLPSYGGVSGSGRTFAESEAITGDDANGDDWDAGAWMLPNQDGSLTNYGDLLYFDPDPDPYARPSIPAGQNDFFSIFLHETMHSLGIWSNAQHGPGNTPTTFDGLTEERNGQFFFNGAAVEALLGEDLPLAATGSRDHYGPKLVGDGTASPVERGLMYEFGNYEGNRWHLGQIDLAILEDLGYDVANTERLPLTELPDDEVVSVPGASANDDILSAQPDTVSLHIDGLQGRDTVVYGKFRSDVSQTWNDNGTISVHKYEGHTDLLVNVERVELVDGVYIYDIARDNLGFGYRIYQAAFGRTPTRVA